MNKLHAHKPSLGICFVACFPLAPTSSLMTSRLALALESQRGRPTLNINSVVPFSSVESRLDISIDVHVHIHPQSLLALAYFESIFCTETLSRRDSRASYCVQIRLDDIGDESDGIVIYAELDTQELNGVNNDTPRILHIRAARLNPISSTSDQIKRKPRPDDPLPRNPLLSAATLSKSDSFTKRRREMSASSISVVSSDRAKKLARTESTNSVRNSIFLEPSVPSKVKVSGTLSRTKSFQPSGDGAREWPGGNAMKVPKPRKPSIQGRLHPDLYGEEDDVFGTMDALRAPSGLRDMSPPDRKPSDGKPSLTVTPGEETLVRINKETIKKAVVSGMSSMGVTKTHLDFKEIYQCVTRGIVLAFRHKMQTQRVEREEVRPYVAKHLEMYIIHDVIQDTK
ncbi:uncharacterized protein EI90DRAFT_819177 [Cantharellus anzutake]|uniref:uncharacterized protein n=1 Tax=Cantharellus anzutake TaxID=1750568 RepID=UPI001904CD93|nr:uncharacterized protein EI90DRAFT_819177 [Cantharellus anzutake]KAF8343011.1 hypothetical protein EI90DRAFT_819177 [Cantharellus anzutake]